MCRLLGANVIEFFFTPSSSSNANTNERREETGAASLEERTNVRNFAGGNPCGQARRCSARVNFQSGGEEIGREETGR